MELESILSRLLNRIEDPPFGRQIEGLVDVREGRVPATNTDNRRFQMEEHFLLKTSQRKYVYTWTVAAISAPKPELRGASCETIRRPVFRTL